MKVLLPNGEQLNLQEDITLDEKIALVEELTIQWREEINSNWSSNSVMYFLDSLSNYLVWHKDDVNSKIEDKEVMSKNKTNRLHRGRKDIPFSNLGDKDRESLFGETREVE